MCIEEPCTAWSTAPENVPACRNATREHVVFEECKKTIDYCVQTPKFHTIDCGEETIYELVPVHEDAQGRSAACRRRSRCRVDVCVTRMVAKRICCCEECWCEMQRQARKTPSTASTSKYASTRQLTENPSRRGWESARRYSTR